MGLPGARRGPTPSRSGCLYPSTPGDRGSMKCTDSEFHRKTQRERPSHAGPCPSPSHDPGLHGSNPNGTHCTQTPGTKTFLPSWSAVAAHPDPRDPRHATGSHWAPGTLLLHPHTHFLPKRAPVLRGNLPSQMPPTTLYAWSGPTLGQHCRVVARWGSRTKSAP